MTSADRILLLLKTRGRQTAQELAELLGVTAMGARRQLGAAHDKGLVAYQDVAGKIGHPGRFWTLTGAGHARFPDRHADLAVQLIEQARSVLGESGLERLITAREHAIAASYTAKVQGQATLPGRVQALARARDAEGYMADSDVQADGSVMLIENHCPICAAARECQDFCRSELAIFQRVLGDDCAVERTEHLLAGARRCVYVIRPVQ